MNILLRPISPAGCMDRVKASLSLEPTARPLINFHFPLSVCMMRERERNSNRPFSQQWLMRTCPSSSHLPNQEWQSMMRVMGPCICSSGTWVRKVMIPFCHSSSIGFDEALTGKMHCISSALLAARTASISF